MAEGFANGTEAGTLLTLRVAPGARSSSIEGTYGENALKVRISAPPVDGKANVELRRFLAEVLGVPRTRVEVVRGESGRDKVVLIRGQRPEEILDSLSFFTA